MSAVAPFPPIDGTQACSEVEPALFFPESEHHAFTAAAVAVCRRCSFLHECLAYALTHDVQGIWGGTSTYQRGQIREEHGITVATHTADLNEHLENTDAQIARMRRGGGASIAEIASVLGLSRKTVERHLYRQKDPA